MSRKKAYWIQLHSHILSDPELKLREKVYLSIIANACHLQGFCTANNCQFNQMCGEDLAIETVSRVISSLVQKGRIKRVEVKEGGKTVERRLWIVKDFYLQDDHDAGEVVEEFSDERLTKRSTVTDERLTKRSRPLDQKIKLKRSLKDNITIQEGDTPIRPGYRPGTTCYFEYCFLTEIEYESLCMKHTRPKVDAFIQERHHWFVNTDKGEQVKNHYIAINTFLSQSGRQSSSGGHSRKNNASNADQYAELQEWMMEGV